MTPSSLATIGQIIWRLIEFHGLDPALLFRKADIDPETIRDPHARIDNRRADVLLRLAAERIPDPSFGLHGTHCWHPSNLG
ncbi:MAG: AraC family transcriptional regulator ligand-binding domain-containing protein, partial [Burkholderiales bacterium]